MYRLNSVVLNKASADKANKIEMANLAIAIHANQHNFPKMAEFLDQSSLDVVISRSSQRLKDREKSPLLNPGGFSSSAVSEGGRTPHTVKERKKQIAAAMEQDEENKIVEEKHS